jgi:dTDP-4-amino-4,6-dideoxygalactose transaminase
LNYRLPDVLCALGVSQLERHQDFKTRKRAIFESYRAQLADVDGVEIPIERSDVNVNWHLFAARFDPAKREAIFGGLRKAGIGVQVNYLPAYRHPIFENRGFREGMYPNSDFFYSQEISLPMYSDLTENELDFIVRNLITLI